MIVNGFTPGSVTSIERRFQLSSQQTGVLISMYDATNIVFVLFVVYVGGPGHKIRWVSVGCLLISLSGFMFALPHFTTPRYSYVSNRTNAVCVPGAGVECRQGSEAGDPGLSNYIYLFGASQVVAGLGSLPLYTLGLSALDESVSNRNYGPYFGIFFAVGVLGPGLGFVLSGVFLNIFTELSAPEGVELSSEDPGWVGAWWLGFIMSGFVILLVAIPLSLFPTELPTTAKIRSEKDTQAHVNAGLEETTRPGFGKGPADLLRALKYLIVNPTFMLTCLGGTADALLLNAYNAYLPKFFENQFAATSGQATLITGGATIVGGVVGTLSGGFIVRRLELKVAGLLRMVALCTAVSGGLFLIMLWHCPQQDLAGVSVNYNGESNMALTELKASCNTNCSCADDQFSPVCAQEAGLEFFTSCHAGCNVDYGNGTYSDCSCLSNVANANPSMRLVAGKCRTDCTYQPLVFAVVVAIIIMIVFTSQIAEINVILRCVPETQRSMSLGVNSLLKRALGSVPGPILFGVVIDGACLLWQDNCGNQGSCWVYNNDSLSLRISIIAAAFKALGLCLYLLALCCYRPVEEGGDVSTKTADAAGGNADVNTNGDASPQGQGMWF
ncbi:solute carrier organic anion transporter family member 4A1-like [Diadema antillarum]|uniref:solute carrier organic anion transporter family member 4A1-like n=1 Tax=Diadema antillarum TaxID=105358 RepID=UPI003A869F88